MGYNTLYITQRFSKNNPNPLLSNTPINQPSNQPTNQPVFLCFFVSGAKKCCQVTFQDDPNFQGSVEVQVVGKDLQSAGASSLRHASFGGGWLRNGEVEKASYHFNQPGRVHFQGANCYISGVIPVTFRLGVKNFGRMILHTTQPKCNRYIAPEHE